MSQILEKRIWRQLAINVIKNRFFMTFTKKNSNIRKYT